MIQSILIKENSKRRRSWDVLLLLLLVTSSILIPYQLVFQHELFGASSVYIYIIDLIFLFDILLNFKTSFRKDGIEILNPTEIARHYSKTNLKFDLLASLPLELLFAPFAMNNPAVIGLVAGIRLIRLLRIYRIFSIFRKWEKSSWIRPIYLRITKFLLMMMILIHLLACFWFYVAARENFPADSWVVTSGISTASESTQYIRSLYWTITTMTTVGYGDITPVRDIEYVVSMIIMLLGASMYAFIIGNIASLLSHLDSGKVSHWNRMESVTEYLQARQVPIHLVTRVRDYYEYLWVKHRGLRDDYFTNDLPESLRLDLLQSLAKELLDNVPLFRYCDAQLRDVLLLALTPNTFDPGSFVAREGVKGNSIFFISKGSVDIIDSDGNRINSFENGEYFGHMSLLLQERRTASVIATSYCETFELSKESYDEIVLRHPQLKKALKKMSGQASEKLAGLVLEGIVL